MSVVNIEMKRKKVCIYLVIMAVTVCIAVSICFFKNLEKQELYIGVMVPVSSEGVWSLGSVNISKPESKEENRDINAAISAAILEKNGVSSPGCDYAYCDFITLDTSFDTTVVGDDEVNTITYYGWALYQEYAVLEKGIKDISGSHIPIALTFEQNKDEYYLKEYWEPRDGSYFVSDVYSKFPEHIAGDGIDSQKFILQQIQSCYGQAIQLHGLQTDVVIGNLLNTICSEPIASSSPQDYIGAHSTEYRELKYYGEYTLYYCFNRFQCGNETGLDGKIMAIACEELLQTKGILPVDASTAESGQFWYDTLLAHAGNIAEPYLKGDKMH